MTLFLIVSSLIILDLEPDPFDSFGNIPNLIEESESQTRGEISQKGI